MLVEEQSRPCGQGRDRGPRQREDDERSPVASVTSVHGPAMIALGAGLARRSHGYPSEVPPGTPPYRRPKRPVPAPPRRRRRRRSRRPLLALLVVAALAAVRGALATGGAVFALGSSCDLDALRPASIGENTFVYAADGSLLGAIPSERNRRVVALSEISPWMPKATVAIEDRRFYDHMRRRRRGHRARALARRAGGRDRGGRLDAHPAARPQPLHLARADGRAEAQGGVPRGQARAGVGQGAHPRRVPQLGALREPGVRHRGGGADVLLEVGERAHAGGVRDARGADPGALCLRPVRRAGQGARAPRTGARRDARARRDHPRAARGRSADAARAEAGAPVHDHP